MMTPNDDHVICPACVNQFRAIPVNVQKLMLDAGFEPPFTTQPAAQPAQKPNTISTEELIYMTGVYDGKVLEREACAKVAQETICDTHIPTGINIYGTRAAKAIRARGNT